ncbi:NAD(P)/FAD-dependent oxidoreductase [Chloroflexota bacterium]
MKIVIIGAGPAGLISALYLIQRGVNPLILEKNPTIKSSACAEACDLKSLTKIPFDSKPYIRKEVKGAKLIYADGTYSYMRNHTVTLDRANWLKGLAREIIARGSQIRLNSEVLAVGSKNIQLKNGDTIDYEILIGADGPNSLVARHIGIRHQLITASQYKLTYDTSELDYLEFYFDKQYSRGFSWIFPKDSTINVGLEGDFTQLDAFLLHKGLSDCKIIGREAGIIPTSGVQRLVQYNIALIGDAAAMTNPMSGGGLTPIIYASQILARHIHNLKSYEHEVKKHPIAAPILAKMRHTLLELVDKDVANLLSFLTKPHPKKMALIIRTIQYPSLLQKLKLMLNTYQAFKILKTYGW